MNLKNLLTGLFILIFLSSFAQNNFSTQKGDKNTPSDSVQLGIDFLRKYIQPSEMWQSENPEILKLVKGLVHFAEDEHIDSILVRLDRFQRQKETRYINRLPKYVSDSLQVRGYQSYPTIMEKMKQLDREIWDGVDLNTIPIPENLLQTTQKGKSIASGDEKAILERTGIVLPDSLKNVNSIPDSLIHTANDFNKIRNRDQIRSHLLEVARVNFNNNLKNANTDSAITAYRKYAVRVFSDSLQNNLRDSLQYKNQQILAIYNDSIVKTVNDSINQFVNTLQQYAQNDSVSIYIHSLTGKPAQVWLRNNQRTANRIYIKNQQNDSLAVRIMNLDKHSLGIAIDDDITFTRIAQKQHRDFVFEKFTPEQRLNKIQKKYQIITPWDMGGNGTFGFTQTYLSNWKAGGKSSFSFLSVLKGYANYSNAKLKWENTGELRNGWIRQGGDLNQTQKNDDKLELISRLGISAFKKWYYSSEIDFITQFFKGYKYPDNKKPISTYLSPAKTLFKLGFDYKPNKNFSLFLSPLTAKYVFVRDTALIDQTKYGVPDDKQSFWEPGFNADLRYKLDISPRISYETKYKIFFNYQEPFKKVDINWENTIVAQLTDRINMTFMLYMLYDDNVTFPTGKFDREKVEIYEPKWQTRELTTIGFSYKINKRIYKQKRLN